MTRIATPDHRVDPRLARRVERCSRSSSRRSLRSTVRRSTSGRRPGVFEGKMFGACVASTRNMCASSGGMQDAARRAWVTTLTYPGPSVGTNCIWRSVLRLGCDETENGLRAIGKGGAGGCKSSAFIPPDPVGSSQPSRSATVAQCVVRRARTSLRAESTRCVCTSATGGRRAQAGP